MPKPNAPYALFFLSGLLALSVPLPAEPPEITADTGLSLQISSRPEAKLALTQSFTLPFLRGSGPLTRDNSLKTGFTAEISPVSVDGDIEITWTPAAFFQITAGGRAGSGWNNTLGQGIGINSPRPDGTGEIRGTAFDGLQWSLRGGGVLQFDLAALFPGDWNHLVFRTAHEARYQAYSRASGDDPWIYENDDGENRNGPAYYGSCLLGYQMPASPFLSMAGLLAEVDKNLSSAPGGDAWGDDLPRWHFAALFNFTVTERFGAALILQMRTRRNYGSSDLENRDKGFYQDQTIDKSDPYRLIFYRAAAILSLKLR